MENSSTAVQRGRNFITLPPSMLRLLVKESIDEVFKEALLSIDDESEMFETCRSKSSKSDKSESDDEGPELEDA